MLRLLDGLVHQHRVVAEGTLQRGSSRRSPQLDRPGEHEGVQGLAQLLLHTLRIGVVVTAQTADEGLLVRDGRIVLLLIGELLEVVIGPTAPVRLRGAQAHDEVSGEDVLGVLRRDEDIGEGCRGVTDVLGPAQPAHELSDEPVDRGALLPRSGTVRFDRVDRGLIGLVVDDEGGNLGRQGPDSSQVLDQIIEHGLVLLDDGDAYVGPMDVVRVPHRPAGVAELIPGSRIKGVKTGLEHLVVVLGTGQATDGRNTRFGESGTIGDESPRLPVDVIGAHVVDVLQKVLVLLTDSPEDVLPSDELHVESALGLGAQDLHGSGEHDDEPVTRVDGLGDDTGEVGGFAALNVTDDQPL